MMTFESLRLTGSHAGDPFELVRKMLDAAVAKLVGDFAESQFAVFQKFFCFS